MFHVWKEHQFPTAAVPFDIPTNNAQVSNTYDFSCFYPNECELASHCGCDVHFLMHESIFYEGGD